MIAEVFGEPAAPHIVFLHGWGMTREALREVASLFRGSHRVHLIDLPGFGEAPVPPSHWGTPEYKGLVDGYLAAHTTGPVTLVGHSFGGRVTVRLAAGSPDRVGSIVLMAVPGLPGPKWTRGAIRGRGIRLLRTLLRNTSAITGPAPLRWHTARFGSADYKAAGKLRDVFVRVVNENLSEDARKVKCPALLLWGADDRETPVWLAHRYRELIGDRAALVLLPHKGHHLQSGTGAHLCAFKIRAWLAAHDDQ